METQTKMKEIYNLRDRGVLIVDVLRHLQYIPYTALIQCIQYALNNTVANSYTGVVTSLFFQQFVDPCIRTIPLERVVVPADITPVLQILCEPTENTQAVYSIDRQDVQGLLKTIATQNPESCTLVKNIGVFSALEIKQHYSSWPDASLIFVSPAEVLILIELKGCSTPVIVFERVNVTALLGKITETSLFE